MAVISLDDHALNQTISHGPYSQLSLSTPLWLGGLPGMLFNQPHRLPFMPIDFVSNQFRGCVQSLHINGRSVDLHKHALLSVNLAACPHKCEQKPCKNGGRCLPSMDQFTCNCSANFKGDHCDKGI